MLLLKAFDPAFCLGLLYLLLLLRCGDPVLCLHLTDALRKACMRLCKEAALEGMHNVILFPFFFYGKYLWGEA